MDIQIRKVSAFTTMCEVTPTVSTAAYAKGDLVGGKLTFDGAGRVGGPRSGVVQNVVIVDQAKKSPTLDVVFFETNPTSTFTDNAAFDPKDADLANSPGFVTVDTYTTFSDNALGAKANAGIGFLLDTASALYGAVVTRTAFTFSATSDLKVKLYVLQD